MYSILLLPICRPPPLQANAMREFELLGPNEDKPNPLLLERLRACCQVINALGYKVSHCLNCKLGFSFDHGSACAPAARSSMPSATRCHVTFIHCSYLMHTNFHACRADQRQITSHSLGCQEFFCMWVRRGLMTAARRFA